MSFIDVIVIGVCFFILGWATSSTIHGGGYCRDCWLALVNGKKYEDGCYSCAMKLNNERYGK